MTLPAVILQALADLHRDKKSGTFVLHLKDGAVLGAEFQPSRLVFKIGEENLTKKVVSS